MIESLAEQALSGALKVGHFVVEFATPGIGHMLKNAGCDFVLFDMEHSGFHHETVKSVVRYFEAAALPAIVRVPSQAYHHVARAADVGAEGVMVPMVNDVAEACALTAACRYTPDGRRGVALGIAHDRYATGDVAAKLVDANRRMTLFAQIETRAGIDNAEAIAAVKGVDCLWIGHFDLSCSLGVPGDFEAPVFKDAVATVVAAARKHDKRLGRLVPDAATGRALYRQGFDFICYGGDVWVYQAALTAGVRAIRDGLG